eukprot:ctg_5135.g507
MPLTTPWTRARSGLRSSTTHRRGDPRTRGARCCRSWHWRSSRAPDATSGSSRPACGRPTPPHIQSRWRRRRQCRTPISTRFCRANKWPAACRSAKTPRT